MSNLEQECEALFRPPDVVNGWAVADPNGETMLAGKPYGVGVSQTAAWLAFCKQAAKRGLIAQGWSVVPRKLRAKPVER